MSDENRPGVDPFQLAPYGATYRPYTPLHWYWLADDGRVYSSERQVTVTTADSAYQTFITGGAATEWPRDATGNQTSASLQAVFNALNIGGATIPTVP